MITRIANAFNIRNGCRIHFGDLRHSARKSYAGKPCDGGPGVDSLDFLDAVFNVERTYDISVPLEEWTQQVNDGTVKGSRYFVLKNFCTEIDNLIAANASTTAA